MINPHVRNFYTYLVLGYITYGFLFFKLCSNGWQFFFACVMFNFIWSRYLARFYLSQAVAEIDAIEQAVIKAFAEAEKDYEEKQKNDKEERVDALQKKSDETSAMVKRMKERSKKD